MSEALLGLGFLIEQARGYEMTAGGAGALRDMGIDVSRLERRSRPLARRCMDWSERRHHLAGSLGAALMSRFIELHRLRPHEASRVVSITAAGRRGLGQWLKLELP